MPINTIARFSVVPASVPFGAPRHEVRERADGVRSPAPGSRERTFGGAAVLAAVQAVSGSSAAVNPAIFGTEKPVADAAIDTAARPAARRQPAPAPVRQQVHAQPQRAPAEPPAGPQPAAVRPREPANLPAARRAALRPQPPAGEPEPLDDFVRRMQVAFHEQHRVGGELQTLRYAGKYSVGVMTAYPANDQEVQDLFERALLKGKKARVINLMNRGDWDPKDPASYVDKIPENGTAYFGDLEVQKSATTIEELGPNSKGGPMTLERTTLYIRDQRHPEKGWQELPYCHVDGWLDTTSPPLETYEKTWKALYKEGPRGQQEDVIHCAGGVGRTPTMALRLAAEARMDAAKRQGVPVTQQDMQDFIATLIEDGRKLRGSQFMPDHKQLRLLMDSIYISLEKRQQAAAAAAPQRQAVVPHRPMIRG